MLILLLIPHVNWPELSQNFIEGLGLIYQRHTTQIEPHDYIAECSDTMVRIHTILIDFTRDIWTYISLGYFKQKQKTNEVGSSTMPHKVNPIDFENAEGNLGLANALFTHMAHKLPISRMQRDLTDSTVLRNIGVAFAYGMIAYQSLTTGMTKLSIVQQQIATDLDQHPEVLAEAIQTLMRKHGMIDAYEQMKSFTRGQLITLPMLRDFIASLDLPEPMKQSLLQLSPSKYIGLAATLAIET